MIIAHRIQLLPSQRQAAHFRKACGIARFTWNWALAEWERQYQAGEKPNALALKKQFLARIDDEWSWMREVANHVYHQPFNDLSAAWQRYFKKLTRRPRFKKRGKSRDSFYLANTGLKFTGNRVRIAKLGEVRLREPLRFQGKLMSARISREADK